VSPLPLPDRFTLFVPGKAIPQGSMKGYVRAGKSGAPVAAITSSNPLLIQWRMKVTGHAIERQAEWMHTHPATEFPITGPVGARVDFVVPRPQLHFGTGRNAKTLKPGAPKYPGTAPDIDKLLRAIFDALTDAQVWEDDGQVVWVQTRKDYAMPGQQVGVSITIGVMR
jgi:Holliday junction resolvase RusA-like endonuclease